MAWTLQSDRPIYAQLVERLKTEIVSGVYPPGGRLPSVRELAATASVNPNTMQKALSELERSGLVYAQRTSGRFITEDEQMLKEMKKEQASRHIAEFFEKMRSLGFRDEETLSLIEEAVKEEH